MKVLSIKCSGKPETIHLYDRYYKLTKLFWVDIKTDEGVLHFTILPEWVTDFRSGSPAIDWLIPWKGNDEYNAIVLAHDCSYSGWLSKCLADELLCKGMVASGEIGKFRASLVNAAVTNFGKDHYYHLQDEMPEPYKFNRQLESFTWTAA